METQIKPQRNPEHKSGDPRLQQKHEERMVRILSRDIEGKLNVFVALTKIKGISWGLSNAICIKLGIDKKRKIGSLSEDEIKKVSEFVKNHDLPKQMFNRQKDFETGKDLHFIGSDLDLRKEFDIKRLKQMKSYKGVRHASKLPVRGQRTKGHFRSNRKKASGIKKKRSVENNNEKKT